MGKTLFFIVMILVFVACSTKKNRVSKEEYQRSNIESQKALKVLDKE